MSSGIDTSWSDLPPYALWVFGMAALGWIVGPFLGYRFGIRSQVESERRKSKNDFRNTIADQKAKLDSMKWNEADFFDQSVSAITAAVYRVEPFVGKKQRTRLQLALQDYQRRRKTDFAGGLTRTASFFESGKSHYDRLRECLDGFHDCIE